MRYNQNTYFAVSPAVLLVVLEADIGETLADGGGGFIGSQDTLARGDNIVGNSAELLLESGIRVVEVGSHFILKTVQ